MNNGQRRCLGIFAFRLLVLFAFNWFVVLFGVLFAVHVCYALAFAAFVLQCDVWGKVSCSIDI